MIGVELDEARALAIGVDDQGQVRARVQVDAAGDLGAAAAKAVAEVLHAMPGAVSGLIGVAATSPESADVASVASQPDHVLSAARDGDGVSISVVRDTARYLGMAAANLVAIADPEMLVLGGIMASNADLLLGPIRAEISRRLPKSMVDALKIECATLGGDAAAIGAARLVAAALP